MGKKIKRDISFNFKLFLLMFSVIFITTSCTKSDEPAGETTQVAPEEIESDFITLYPGVYTEKEKDLVKEYFAEAKAIEERGMIDIDAMINGKLPEDTPGYVRSLKISETMVRYFNELRDPESPLLNDSAYAKKAGYKDIIAYPTFAAHDDSFMVAYPGKARDTLLVADLIHSVTNYKPVYPGDTLYWVINARHVKDLTPETGSIYRSNHLVNDGSVYNQRGEKVLDVQYTVQENIKIYKEGLAPENPSFSDMWEERSMGERGESGEGERGEGVPEGGAPEGGARGEGAREGGAPGEGGDFSRATYYYTDEDWEILKDLWTKEKHQGSTPLYWEDVEIGDQPTWTLEGPVESNPSVSVPWGMGLGGNQTLKKYIMDSKVFKTLVRSEEDGIYRPANEEDYILPVPDEARTGMAFGEMGEMDAVLSGAAGDIPGGEGARGSGMPGGDRGGEMPEGGMPGGDRGGEMPEGGMPGGAPGGGMPGGEGARGGMAEGGGPGGGAGGGGGMGGGLMNFTRRDYAIRHFSDWMGDSGWLYNIRWGGLYSKDMIVPGEPSPAFNPDANHWFEDANVPDEITEPSYVLGQGKGDSKFIIIKSYVYNKYVKDGEFYVDLAWWIESVGGSSFGKGAATVTLPSKNAK